MGPLLTAQLQFFARQLCDLFATHPAQPGQCQALQRPPPPSGTRGPPTPQTPQGPAQTMHKHKNCACLQATARTSPLCSLGPGLLTPRVNKKATTPTNKTPTIRPPRRPRDWTRGASHSTPGWLLCLSAALAPAPTKQPQSCRCTSLACSPRLPSAPLSSAGWPSSARPSAPSAE